MFDLSQMPAYGTGGRVMFDPGENRKNLKYPDKFMENRKRRKPDGKTAGQEAAARIRKFIREGRAARAATHGSDE